MIILLRQNYRDDWKSMSIYGGVGKCHKQIMDLAIHLPLTAALHIHTKLLISKHYFRQYMYKYRCLKTHFIPNVIAARNLKNTYLIFGPLYLAMYYTGSVNWREVLKNICGSQKKHPKMLKLLCQHFLLPDFLEA